MKKYNKKTYEIWKSMKQRCYNKNSKDYKNYGARGIGVCKEWRESFINFYNDMGDKPNNRSLDRIDNDKSYSKENCRWATRIEQANNTRRNHLLEYNGEIKTISQWSNKYNIKQNIIIKRLNRGWSIKKTLTTKSMFGLLKKGLLQKKNGDIIKEFSSLSSVKREGFNAGHISECCNGKRKTHKGFEWEYL